MTKRTGADLFGHFLKNTLAQLETVREVVVQKSKAGKIQLEITLLRRKRRAALARLGEAVMALAGQGRINERRFPELSGALGEVDALDDRIEREERRARAAAMGMADAGANAGADDGADDGDADLDHEEYDEVAEGADAEDGEGADDLASADDHASADDSEDPADAEGTGAGAKVGPGGKGGSRSRKR